MSEALETRALELEQELPLSRREELVARLEHVRGVRLALFDARDTRRLTVASAPGTFSDETLLDFLRHLGVTARVVEAAAEG